MNTSHFVWTMIVIFTVSSLYAQHERTEHWHERNQLFIRELDNIPPGKTIFLGNSITEGFDLERFFPVIRPVNRGIMGDHIDGLLERLETSVIRLKPGRLFLKIGINDIGAGDPDSVILDNYQHLMDTLKSSLPETAVFIQSILPTSTAWSNCPKEKIVRLNDRVQKMAGSFGFNWINLYPLFADKSGYLRQELTTDGLHLNQRGYRVWAKVLYGKGLE